VKKKIFLFLAATLSLFSVDSTHAQQTGKALRIGFLDSSTVSDSAVLVENPKHLSEAPV
jgi:hypothetical protein